MQDRAPSTRQKAILVIAKDPGLRMIVEASLKDDGACAVFSAPSAAAALAPLPVCTPDLIVYMLDAPAQPSAPAVASVRRRAPFATLPMIVVGGDEYLLSRAWPATAFLPYPLRIAHLTRRVAALLDRVPVWP